MFSTDSLGCASRHPAWAAAGGSCEHGMPATRLPLSVSHPRFERRIELGGPASASGQPGSWLRPSAVISELTFCFFHPETVPPAPSVFL